jgi:chemosensory pili system protein ChpA (sensor histidine kinase/response regulator)
LGDSLDFADESGMNTADLNLAADLATNDFAAADWDNDLSDVVPNVEMANLDDSIEIAAMTDGENLGFDGLDLGGDLDLGEDLDLAGDLGANESLNLDAVSEVNLGEDLDLSSDLSLATDLDLGNDLSDEDLLGEIGESAPSSSSDIDSLDLSRVDDELDLGEDLDLGRDLDLGLDDLNELDNDLDNVDITGDLSDVEGLDNFDALAIEEAPDLGLAAGITGIGAAGIGVAGLATAGLAAGMASDDLGSIDDLDNMDDLMIDLPDDGMGDLDTFLADEGLDSDLTDTSEVDFSSSGVSSFRIDDTDSGEFSDLDALLDNDQGTGGSDDTGLMALANDSEFGDLEKLLDDTDQTLGGATSARTVAAGGAAPGRRQSRPGKVFGEQTMRVPVKHLDNLSNLVGELVVNRNSLEQDQERMRQSLDNMLYQVQQLSDVGQRMQDLYERSLLESSLLASRQNRELPSFLPVAEPSANGGVEYDPLEMDRFTGFHTLSQEMIELIVRVRESASDIGFIVDETDQVTRMFRQVTTQLQEGLTRSRMVPFAQTADRLPRAVRDIAMKVGKQAELVVEGRETLIDKMILEHLYDPMTHLVNNAITHGIEEPNTRQGASKNTVGKITIRAFHQGNQTVISVSDDGAGLDVDRIRSKAIEKGLISSTEAQTMGRMDLYDLIFHPGFSTRDQADDFAGRGVGMDVVRTSLTEIRGAVSIDSNPGKGTTFTIRLPLTLSISKALCCISDRARIAFPMDGVEDMLDLPKERVQTNAEGQLCIPWRDTVLPLRPLTELLSHNRHLSRGNVYGGNQEEDVISVVVLRSAGNYLALQVDQVLGEQEIVIKQLEGPVPKPVGIAGATVLGDGRIMPIADVLELIDISMGRIRREPGSMWEQDGNQAAVEVPPVKTDPLVLIVDDSITVRELLSMTFNKVGYRVEQARDGQEAWEKLRAGLPCDIVFCDIEMPRMDGLELLSRIQKDPNLKRLPVAMLTSRGADRHRQMATSLGAKGYFTKPYLEEALLDAAGRMLKGEVLISNK